MSYRSPKTEKRGPLVFARLEGPGGKRAQLEAALICAALVVWRLATAGTAQNAGGFKLDGMLECTFFRASGDIFKAQALEFEIKVAGKKWQMTNIEGGTNRWLRGSDGVELTRFDGHLGGRGAWVF